MLLAAVFLMMPAASVYADEVKALVRPTTAAEEAKTKYLTEEEKEKVKAILRAGLRERKEKILFMDYQMTRKQFDTLFFEVLLEREFFYVSAWYNTRILDNDEDKVAGVCPRYLEKISQVQRQRLQLDNYVNHTASRVSPKWTDLQKLLFIHDTVALRITYDNRGKDTDTSPFYAFFYRHGSCTSYARLFAYIAQECGYECKLVISKTHMWNMVKVGNQWYHVDVTFDDSAKENHISSISEDGETVSWGDITVSHMYFLISDRRLNTLCNNYGEDRLNYIQSFVPAASDKKYEGMPWTQAGSISPVAIIGDRIYYSVAGKVYHYNQWTKKSKLIYSSDKYWLVKGRNDRKWPLNYTQVAEVNGRLYVNTPTNILMYDTVKGKFRTLKHFEAESGTFFGIAAEDDKLFALMADDNYHKPDRKEVTAITDCYETF